MQTRATMKCCVDCKRWLPLADFPVERMRSDGSYGRKSRCRVCHSERNRRHSRMMNDTKKAAATLEGVMRAWRS